MPLKTRVPIAPANAPYLPPTVAQEIVWAIKAVNAGEADKGQQALAMRWIITELCKSYDFPYRPGSDEGVRDTDVALGKMFCGQQLVRLINMTPEQITRLPKMRGDVGEDDAIQNM